MHLHVLKCYKATLDMSPIIMGNPSDVDGGMNKLFWVLFFFYIDTKWFLSLLWKTNIGVKTYLWINLLPITDVNNGDIPGTRTMAHLLLQYFFLQKQKRLLYLSHLKWFKYNCDSYFFKNVQQYNAIHLYNVTMRNEHQFHMRNVVNTYIT